MYQLKVSETVFPGAELQVSLRLSTQGLAAFLGTEEPADELSAGAHEALHPLRRYMAAIAAKLPELIDAGSPVLLEHQVSRLQEQNALAVAQLDSLRE